MLLGVVTQRIVGFGIALFVAPILLIYFSGPVAVTVTIFVGTLALLALLYSSRNDLQIIWPLIIRLSLFAIPGLILGAYVVTRVDKAFIQIAVGLLIILSATIQQYFLPRPRRELGVSRGAGLTGLLSGFFNTAVAMGPLPLVIYLRFHKSTPEQVRQTIAMAFVFVNVVSVIAVHLFKPSSFTPQGVRVALFMVPIVILGSMLGKALIPKINPRQYQRILLYVVVASGLVSMVYGISDLV